MLHIHMHMQRVRVMDVNNSHKLLLYISKEMTPPKHVYGGNNDGDSYDDNDSQETNASLRVSFNNMAQLKMPDH